MRESNDQIGEAYQRPHPPTRPFFNLLLKTKAGTVLSILGPPLRHAWVPSPPGDPRATQSQTQTQSAEGSQTLKPRFELSSFLADCRSQSPEPSSKGAQPGVERSAVGYFSLCPFVSFVVKWFGLFRLIASCYLLAAHLSKIVQRTTFPLWSEFPTLPVCLPSCQEKIGQKMLL